MRDQPWNLDQTWPVGRKWCRFTNASKHFEVFPQIRGAKNIKFLPHFLRLPQWKPHIYGTKRRIDKPKCNVNLQCVVTFDPETAEIRFVILTHPMEIQHFPYCRASHTKATKPKPTKFCQTLESLWGLLST